MPFFVNTGVLHFFFFTSSMCMGMHIYLTMYNIIGSILHISIGGDACAIAYDHLMYYPLIVSTLMCFRLYSDNLYMFGYMKRKKNRVHRYDGNRNHFAGDIFSWLYTTEQAYTNLYIFISWMTGKSNSISCCYYCSEEHNDLGGMLIYYIIK
jgi:hypothetical protein